MRKPRSTEIPSDPRIFTFDLVVETHPLLAYRSGDVAELIGDGLFALDREGRLFPQALPALKDGGRLLHVHAEAVGFGRGRAGLTEQHADAMSMGSQPAGSAEQHSEPPSHKSEVGLPLARLSRAILRLRALEARGRAASDQLTAQRFSRKDQYLQQRVLLACIANIATSIDTLLDRIGHGRAEST